MRDGEVASLRPICKVQESAQLRFRGRQIRGPLRTGETGEYWGDSPPERRNLLGSDPHISRFSQKIIINKTRKSMNTINTTSKNTISRFSLCMGCTVSGRGRRSTSPAPRRSSASRGVLQGLAREGAGPGPSGRRTPSELSSVPRRRRRRSASL